MTAKNHTTEYPAGEMSIKELIGALEDYVELPFSEKVHCDNPLWYMQGYLDGENGLLNYIKQITSTAKKKRMRKP
jgi:hypothetical protein